MKKNLVLQSGTFNRRLLFLAILSFAATAHAVSSADCGNAWRIVPTPNFGSGNNELYDVGVVSAGDVWAVGRYSDAAGYKTLAMHWDGNQWAIVPTPNVGSAFNHLFSVAAVSSNNVWAVGASSDNNLLYQTLIEHWDGTQWSVMTSPLAPGTSSYLYGIAAVAADNIWAVGYIQIGFSAQQPLTLHWDGTSWTLVLSPSTAPTNNDVLWAIAALSATDIWASGTSTDRVSGNYSTLIEHWDGSAWSIVPSPNPSGSIYNFLWGIAALSPNEVWTIGRSYTGSTYPGLIEHWDGTTWSILSSPSEQSYTELYGVSAQSSNDVWAVGRQGDGFTQNLTLIEHWKGTDWSLVAHPEPAGSTESYLYKVNGSSANNLWAVGAYLKDDTVYQTLIEQYSDMPCILNVVSRRVHGSAGTFDVDLTAGDGIECRSGGAGGDYMIVFTFASPLANVSAASVTTGTGSIANAKIDPNNAHNYIVNVTGVTNAQRIAVSLNNVTDSAGGFSSSVSAQMGVLIGDVNASGVVTSGDTNLCKAQALQPVRTANFRNDINASGSITTGDVNIIKQNALTHL